MMYLILLAILALCQGEGIKFPDEKQPSHDSGAPVPENRFFGLFGGGGGHGGGHGLLGGGGLGGHGGGHGLLGGGGLGGHGGGHGLLGGKGHGGHGLFGGNIFCRNSCSFYKLKLSNQCCQMGEIHCCQFVNTGSPVGGHIGIRPPGITFPGLTKPPGGYGGGGHIGGYGGGHQGGYGGGHQGGYGGGQQTKHGFCPRPSLLGKLFGARNGVADDPTEVKKEVHFRTKRQMSSSPSADYGKSPNQRFLPGLSSLPNIFCRDQCFTDRDCPGPLKCCIDFGNCRDCTYPQFPHSHHPY